MKNRGLALKDAFRVDNESISNLSWNIEIRCGIHDNVLKCWIGKPCDHISKTTKRFRVEYCGRSYEVSRLVLCIYLGEDYFDNSFLVDHIDGNPLNNKIENLRKASFRANARNTAKRISTDVTGVNLHNSNKKYQYWRARWADLQGKQHEKRFSISERGFHEAREMAILYRQKMIDELNISNAGYTERHGK